MPLYASNEEYSLKEVTPNHKEFKHSIVTLCFKPVPFYASSHMVVEEEEDDDDDDDGS